MKRCKSCLYKSDVADGVCPVCGIQQDKPKRALTPEEKRIRYAARGVRGVALLHTLGGCILLLSYLAAVAGIGETRPALSVGEVLIPVLGALLLVLSSGLRRFAKWSYYAALLFYAAVLIGNLFKPNAGLLVLLLCAYYVGNTRALALFNRSLKPPTSGAGRPADEPPPLP